MATKSPTLSLEEKRQERLMMIQAKRHKLAQIKARNMAFSSNLQKLGHSSLLLGGHIDFVPPLGSHGLSSMDQSVVVEDISSSNLISSSPYITAIENEHDEKLKIDNQRLPRDVGSAMARTSNPSSPASQIPRDFDQACPNSISKKYNMALNQGEEESYSNLKTSPKDEYSRSNLISQDGIHIGSNMIASMPGEPSLTPLRSKNQVSNLALVGDLQQDQHKQLGSWSILERERHAIGLSQCDSLIDRHQEMSMETRANAPLPLLQISQLASPPPTNTSISANPSVDSCTNDDLVKDQMNWKKNIQHDPSFKAFIQKSAIMIDRSLSLGERYDLLEGQIGLGISKEKSNWLSGNFDQEDEDEDDNDEDNDHGRNNSSHCDLHGDFFNRSSTSWRPIRLLSSFSDPKWTPNISIVGIDWNPWESHKVLSVMDDRHGSSGSSLLEWHLDYNHCVESCLSLPCLQVTAGKYWHGANPLRTLDHGEGRGDQIVVTSSYTGQIHLWDLRQSQHPMAIISDKWQSTSPSLDPQSTLSSFHHQHPIRAIDIIDSHHFASSDSSGMTAIWDIYNLKHPLEQLNLVWTRTNAQHLPLDLNQDSLSSSTISTDSSHHSPLKQLNTSWIQSRSQSQPTSMIDHSKYEVPVQCMAFGDENQFYVGSEDGGLYTAQRHGDIQGLVSSHPNHNASITSVKVHPSMGHSLLHNQTPLKLNKMNPLVESLKLTSTNRQSTDFLHHSLPSWSSTTAANAHTNLISYSVNDLLLTSSLDWSVSCWHLKTSPKPLITLTEFNDYVMDTSWSRHHPALWVAVDASGILSLFNFNDAHHGSIPSINDEASPEALNQVLWSPHHSNLIIASSHASRLHLYKIDKALSRPRDDEWQRMENTIQYYHQLHGQPAQSKSERPYKWI